MPWLKWDNRARHDRKLRILSPSGRCLWVALCEIGSELQSAEICVVPGVPYENKDLAEEAAIPVEDVEPALQMMERLQMIERRPDCIFVINLQRRQGWDGDNSAERTRKYRERKRKGVTTGDGPCDGDVTECDGGGDAAVTPVDSRSKITDTEIHPVVVTGAAPADDPNKKAGLEFVNRFNGNWALSGNTWGDLLDFAEALGWPLIIEAVKRTGAAGTKDLKYCLGILQSWTEKGIRSVQEALADDAAHKAEIARQKKQREQNQPRGRGAPRGQHDKRSNVIWTPKDGRPKDPGQFDHIYKRFDGDPDPPPDDGRESA